jgi:hypothetical protein
MIGVLYQKIKSYFNQKYYKMKLYFYRRYQKLNDNDDNVGNNSDDLELQNQPHETIKEQINLENNNKENVNININLNHSSTNNEENKNIYGLSNDDIKKRKILLNKIYLLFENNKFILDTKRANIYEYDIFHKISRVKNNTDKIYEENINILKLYHDEHICNLTKYDTKSNKEVNFILTNYFINCGAMYPESIHKCKKCSEEIYIYENLCYTCSKIYFEKCEDIEHYAKNSTLPPMKKYSGDFIVHIQKCLLNSKEIINEIYDFMNE